MGNGNYYYHSKPYLQRISMQFNVDVGRAKNSTHFIDVRTASPPLREEEYPLTNNLITSNKPYRGPCRCFNEDKHDGEDIHNLRIALHDGICVGSTRDLPRGIYI